MDFRIGIRDSIRHSICVNVLEEFIGDVAMATGHLANEHVHV